MLITSCHTAICQSVAEVQLTGVAPLGAVSHRFNLNLILIVKCEYLISVNINFKMGRWFFGCPTYQSGPGKDGFWIDVSMASQSYFSRSLPAASRSTSIMTEMPSKRRSGNHPILQPQKHTQEHIYIIFLEIGICIILLYQCSVYYYCYTIRFFTFFISFTLQNLLFYRYSGKTIN